jgi:hypothetical protein
VGSLQTANQPRDQNTRRRNLFYFISGNIQLTLGLLTGVVLMLSIAALAAFSARHANMTCAPFAYKPLPTQTKPIIYSSPPHPPPPLPSPKCGGFIVILCKSTSILQAYVLLISVLECSFYRQNSPSQHRFATQSQRGADSDLAVSRPMPVLAPVTMTVFPSIAAKTKEKRRIINSREGTHNTVLLRWA